MEKREVTYDGKTYKVRRDDVVIPALDTLDRLAALIWLNQNTYGKGRSTRPVNPLAGYGGVIQVRS